MGYLNLKGGYFRLDKRIKIKLYLTILLVLLCILLVPNAKVYAYFSDDISEYSGIELTLGSIDLKVKEKSNRIVNLETGQNKVQLEETIQNEGTLTGKIAYRILFKNINSNKVSFQSEYKMLTDGSSNNSLMIEPNESKVVSVEVDITSIQSQIEHTEVQIEFLLFQTNGTIEKPLFHDNEAVFYNLKLTEDPFWNNNDVDTVGNYKIAIEKPNTFYFIKNDKKHLGMNVGIIYIESKHNVKKWENVINFSSSPHFSISRIDTDANNNRAKIYFYLDRPTTTDLNKVFYTNKSSIYIGGSKKEFEYNANLIFLSSDLFNSSALSIEESAINIGSSANERISLQYMTKSDDGFKRNDLKFDSVNLLSAVIKRPLWWDEPLEVLDNKISLDVNGFIKLIEAITSGNIYKLEAKLSHPKENNIIISRYLTYKVVSETRSVKFDGASNLNIDNSKNYSSNENKVSKRYVAPKNEDKTDKSSFDEQNKKIEKVKPDSKVVAVPESEENRAPENQIKSPEKQTDKPKEQINELDEFRLPTDEQFKYMELIFNEKSYYIGLTQDQINWIMKYKTIQEFSDQLTGENQALYVKYDKIVGIDNIEQYIYQLAEEKQLDFEIVVEDIPERDILQIKFTR